jgi:hypothetical protein
VDEAHAVHVGQGMQHGVDDPTELHWQRARGRKFWDKSNPACRYTK